MIHGERATALYLDGVNLTPYLREAGVQLTPWQEQVLTMPVLRPVAFTMRGHYDPTAAWAIQDMLTLWRRQARRRISRMHAAYGRKHGRGRE